MIKLEVNKIYCGDALEVLKTFPDECIDMAITSPPYWALRDYGVKGQLGLEPTFKEYITKLCDIFDEVKRVLKKEGTCWVNLGDTYGGSWQDSGSRAGGQREKKTKSFKRGDSPSRGIPPSANAPSKCLLQIPSRFAIEMTNRGWILRNEVIWYKPNVMPSSAKDRFTVDFEKLFFFTKSKKYYFEQQLDKVISLTDNRIDDGRKEYNGKFKGDKNAESYNSPRARTQRKTQQGFVTINTEGKNKRTVWKIATKPYPEAHFAVYPPELIETPIKAGCPESGVVLDMFMGSGTTAEVARNLNRNYVGIELNAEYIPLIEDRLKQKKLI